MANCLKNLDSQKKFVKYLLKSHLEEFLCRINSKQYDNAPPSMLAQNIIVELVANHQDLLTNHPNIKVKTEIKQSFRNKMIDVYAIIKFMENNIEIGHMTFHLVPTCFDNNIGNGPIHVRNNLGKQTRRLRITPGLCNLQKFELSSTVIANCEMNQVVNEMSQATLDVFNRWFDPSKPEHLSIKQCKVNDFVKQKVDIVRGKKNGGTRRKIKRKQNNA